MPFARRHFGDDLLGQNIERLFWYGKLIELAATDTIEQCRAFDQIVAREWEQAAFGHATDRMSRAPNPLKETRDRAWGTELANQRSMVLTAGRKGNAE